MSAYKEKSAELFEEGYSCSEAVVRAAAESGILNQDIDTGVLNALASSFSGGMGGSGCACGAVTGAQIILGLILGRKERNSDTYKIRKLSGKLMERFKEKRKAVCCRVLTSQFQGKPAERRNYCQGIVTDAVEILENILKESSAKP